MKLGESHMNNIKLVRLLGHAFKPQDSPNLEPQNVICAQFADLESYQLCFDQVKSAFLSLVGSRLHTFFTLCAFNMREPFLDLFSFCAAP